MASLTYSTGPLENENGEVLERSTSVFINILNNNSFNTTKAHIKVFSMNGTKVQIGEAVFNVPPLSSDFVDFDVSDTVVFEVQIQIKNQIDGVLITVFGKNAENNLVAAHRVLQHELTLIAVH